MSREEPGLFPALLRHWRTRRGLSQLDLSIAAEVSSRHISFLETGRAQPSREMVLVLGGALDVPFRDQNVLLRAAGFAEQFAEPSWREGLPPQIERVLAFMLQKQEPYPMVVLSHAHDIVRANVAALRVFLRFSLDPIDPSKPLNLVRALFDPRQVRPFVKDWERVARSLLTQLQREAYARPSDVAVQALLNEAMAYPDVPKSFQKPDFAEFGEPTLSVQLSRGDLTLSFLTTMTLFNSPQSVTLQELRIESYFPLDAETERACVELSRDS
jgi:transcriptional regulator with XRE-family HTH domain